MYDNPDLDKVMNEILITFVVPGLLTLTAVWASFVLIFDETLRSIGLAPIEVQEGYGAVASGHGRFLLLIVVTTLCLLVYIAFYNRFVRETLQKRNIV